MAGLRPAKQTLLRQKFQEIDEEAAAAIVLAVQEPWRPVTVRLIIAQDSHKYWCHCGYSIPTHLPPNFVCHIRRATPLRPKRTVTEAARLVAFAVFQSLRRCCTAVVGFLSKLKRNCSTLTGPVGGVMYITVRRRFQQSRIPSLALMKWLAEPWTYAQEAFSWSAASRESPNPSRSLAGFRCRR